MSVVEYSRHWEALWGGKPWPSSSCSSCSRLTGSATARTAQAFSERSTNGTGRAVSIGALYATLSRLERKGLITLTQVEPAAGQRGRPRKYCALTRAGLEATRGSTDMVVRDARRLDLACRGRGRRVYSMKQREERTDGPPTFARWLLSKCLSDADRRFVLGDLDEEFHRRQADLDARAGRRWYRRQVWRSLFRFYASGPRVGPTCRRYRISDSPSVHCAAPLSPWSPLLCLSASVSGAVTTVFALVSQTVMAPPVGLDEPSRIVTLYTSEDDGGLYGSTSFLDAEDLARALPALQDVAVASVTLVTVTDGGAVESLLAEEVSANYFDVMGSPVRIGRPFTVDAADGPGSQNTVVIGHDLWRRRFAEDPGVLGRTLDLDGHSYTVIGVARDGVSSRRVPLEPDVCDTAAAARPRHGGPLVGPNGPALPGSREVGGGASHGGSVTAGRRCGSRPPCRVRGRLAR